MVRMWPRLQVTASFRVSCTAHNPKEEVVENCVTWVRTEIRIHSIHFSIHSGWKIILRSHNALKEDSGAVASFAQTAVFRLTTFAAVIDVM